MNAEMLVARHYIITLRHSRQLKLKLKAAS